MKLIEIKNLSKTYQTLENEIKALDNINIDINEHEIVSFIGPSGCGKTTIFDALTNIISYDGIIKKNKDLNIGYMMQTNALLPWKSVYENAILTLKLTNKINNESINYIKDLLKKYDLIDFINENPNNLSGGQKQRLSLIRTLATKPNILLLDEAFSKLDIMTKNVIMDDIYKVIKELNITCILITHNINEALMFSDKIIILSKRPSKVKKIILNESKDLPSKRIINQNKYNEIRKLLYE